MRRRASGAGRKPLNPEDRNSAALNIRVRPDVRRALLRLAAKRERNRYLSREIQEALDSWIERLHSRPPHIEALSSLAVSLGFSAESFTGKHWNDDLFTAQAIVAALNQVMTFRDLGGVAKKPSNYIVKKPSSYKKPFLWITDSPKALGDTLAFSLIMMVGTAGARSEEFAAYLKTTTQAGDDAVAAVLTNYKRMFRGIGSRINKQAVAKYMAKYIEGVSK